MFLASCFIRNRIRFPVALEIREARLSLAKIDLRSFE